MRDSLHYCLMKGELVFQKSQGDLLDSVTSQDRSFSSPCEGSGGYQTPQLVKNMLAFMIRPIFQPSLAFMMDVFPLFS